MKIKKHIKQFLQRACALGLSLAMFGQPIVSLAEPDYTEAGLFKELVLDSKVYISTTTGKKYHEGYEGGYTVYVPYDGTMNGEEILKNMFTGLFDVYSSGKGKNYDNAGAKYNASGYSTIAGVQTKYHIKSLSIDDSGESVLATSNLGTYEPRYNVEFRYAGILVSPTTYHGKVITNPTFVSDTTWDVPGSGKVKRTFQRYDKEGAPISGADGSVVLYQNENSDYPVVNYEDMLTYWDKGSGIPTFNPAASEYNKNPEKVQKTFEKWAATTKIGAKYKSTYVQWFGDEWWSKLGEKMQIDGDVDEQSSLIRTVFEWAGGTYYSTYSIPYPLKNNTYASKIQIVDEKLNVLDYSERRPSANAYEGADVLLRNVKTNGGSVKLEKGKTYTVELAMTYMSADNTESITHKDEAKPEVEVRFQPLSLTTAGKGRETAKSSSTHDTENTSKMQQMTAAEADRNDPTTSGPIKANATGVLGGYGESITYNFGQTTLKVVGFTLQENDPDEGILRFAVPLQYSENGDNSYPNDDKIEIWYTTDKDAVNPDPPENNEVVEYGDMNLGRREYRRLHYWKEVEEPNPEKPIMAVNPETGLEEPTGQFEMMKVEYEFVTDYGWWDSYSDAPEGEKAGKWDGIPESSGSIYHVDGEKAWWEYSQVWPDQGADEVYKIWLTRNGENWSSYNESYTRSETEDNLFGLGFSVSRSRGDEGAYFKPTIKVELYGISPETDDDGELIETRTLTGNPIGMYDYSENNYIFWQNQGIATRLGNYDYPFIRVKASIDKSHGESGIYGDPRENPYNNGWQDSHDVFERVFQAKSDDLELTDVKIKDSEGVVIYHAEQEDGEWTTIVKGYFDKDEDYSMDVEMKQTQSAGHNVKDPAINVKVIGQDKNGNDVSTYVDRVVRLEGEEMSLDETVTFKDICFRAKDVFGIGIEIEINNRHGSTNWRENKWDDDTDTFNDRIQCTTANLKVSPNIEVVNSKYNVQNYLTFAEKLNFKFDIQHIGEGERQMAIVGNSSASPLARLDVAIYNADKLTKDPYGNLKFDNVKLEDPKASGALIWSGTSTAETRLYPGLGSMNYASHVQSWIHNYVVQSHKTLSGNVAAYGHILVTAQISDIMHTKGLNENTSPAEDYVQQEFVGEHNIAIVDMAVTGQNSISDNSWYYGSSNRNPATGEQVIQNKNGISVSVAIQNQPSSFADSTVVDRTYLDIFIGNDDIPVKTVIVDLPQGDTVPVEVVIPDVLIERDMVVTAKVNYGTHQTHYEYVLERTDPVLNQDPFADNMATRTVSPNLPDTESSPSAEIFEHIPNAAL